MTSVNKDREKLELSYIDGRTVNGAATMENSSGAPQNVKHRVTI